jgi:demethylmenaquinone methyltransferase/2-methoxy-6-polyprenyl-1,4-benzoquinol methylase
MSNTYYQPGEQRGERVRDLFDRIASRYDLINDLQSFGLHRWWKRQVARLAEVQAGSHVLDVCCGTGDITRALAARGGRAVGLDFSEAMLRVARSRGTASGNPEYTQGDAQNLPFNDGSFDAVTVGYGLRNLPDWKQGLAEMARVARSGGRIVALDFGKPPNAAWRAAYFSYLRLFVPLLGRLFCGDSRAYSYILESLTHYPAQEGVREEMLKLGLTDVRVVMFLGGVMTINFGRKK